jgi:exonuclease III
MPSISNKHQQTAVMPTENGFFKEQLTLNVGEDLRICHFNTEEISKAKCEILTKIMNKERKDVIALQETHTKDDDLQKRGYIARYILIEAIHHKQYGIATYVKENIDGSRVVHKVNSGNIQVLATKIGSITVTNVYKPPNNK